MTTVEILNYNEAIFNNIYYDASIVNITSGANSFTLQYVTSTSFHDVSINIINKGDKKFSFNINNNLEGNLDCNNGIKFSELGGVKYIGTNNNYYYYLLSASFTPIDHSWNIVCNLMGIKNTANKTGPDKIYNVTSLVLSYDKTVTTYTYSNFKNFPLGSEIGLCAMLNVLFGVSPIIDGIYKNMGNELSLGATFMSTWLTRGF